MAATKKELKAFTDDIAQTIGAKSTHVFVGTWMDRPGVSLECRKTTKPLGLRVIVHKWDDEETCTVRLVEGDGWKDPENFVEHGKVEGVDFASYNIALVAYRDLKVRWGS